MTNIDTVHKVSETDRATIIEAADEIMMNLAFNTEGKPTLMIGALAMAIGILAARARVPYDVLVSMISYQYGNELMSEVNEVLDEPMIIPSDVGKN